MTAMNKPGPSRTPAVFYILLGLFGKKRDGYDIVQQVEPGSGAAVKVGPGTLHGSLDRMIEARLGGETRYAGPAQDLLQAHDAWTGDVEGGN